MWEGSQNQSQVVASVQGIHMHGDHRFSSLPDTKGVHIDLIEGMPVHVARLTVQPCTVVHLHIVVSLSLIHI